MVLLSRDLFGLCPRPLYSNQIPSNMYIYIYIYVRTQAFLWLEQLREDVRSSNTIAGKGDERRGQVLGFLLASSKQRTSYGCSSQRTDSGCKTQICIYVYMYKTFCVDHK